jgi:hypothetical protein
MISNCRRRRKRSDNRVTNVYKICDKKIQSTKMQSVENQIEKLVLSKPRETLFFRMNFYILLVHQNVRQYAGL